MKSSQCSYYQLSNRVLLNQHKNSDSFEQNPNKNNSPSDKKRSNMKINSHLLSNSIIFSQTSINNFDKDNQIKFKHKNNQYFRFQDEIKQTQLRQVQSLIKKQLLQKTDRKYNNSGELNINHNHLHKNNIYINNQSQRLVKKNLFNNINMFKVKEQTRKCRYQQISQWKNNKTNKNKNKNHLNYTERIQQKKLLSFSLPLCKNKYLQKKQQYNVQLQQQSSYEFVQHVKRQPSSQHSVTSIQQHLLSLVDRTLPLKQVYQKVISQTNEQTKSQLIQELIRSKQMDLVVKNKSFMGMFVKGCKNQAKRNDRGKILYKNNNKLSDCYQINQFKSAKNTEQSIFVHIPSEIQLYNSHKKSKKHQKILQSYDRLSPINFERYHKPHNPELDMKNQSNNKSIRVEQINKNSISKLKNKIKDKSNEKGQIQSDLCAWNQ